MSDKQEKETGSSSLLEAWIKASTDFWETTLRMTSGGLNQEAAHDSSTSRSGGRTKESWEAAMKTWRTMAGIMEKPGAMDDVFRGLGVLPGAMAKMIQPAWNGLFHLQQEWMERAARIGKSTSAYSFENLDQETFKAWTEVYEKEFRQFLKAPQLGLTRFYQERLAEATDKFNLFETTLAEFISLLYLPMEKSFQVLQDEVGKMAESGVLPTNQKDYYKMWVKILEGHYMNLFRSPEYLQTLAKTLDAIADFTVARHEVLQDVLQSLPLPTHKEMDELYREIYLLKKRLKALEKKNLEQGETEEA